MQRGLKRALGLGSTFAIVGIAGWLALSTATPGRAADETSKGYVPGLGDLMNASLQTHHSKLWFAGHADNWALAAYEVKEMRETTSLMENVFPMWHDLNVGEMVRVLDFEPQRTGQGHRGEGPGQVRRRLPRPPSGM